MEKHIVKVSNVNFVTHNVKRFVVEKPQGYTYVPGQATELSINKPGLEEELRPFTFTSIPAWDTLEFVIKIYTGHSGMTEKLLDVAVGDELILHDVFGAINYKGPGLFIAGGAGITPFISILRQLYANSDLAGNSLLFANRTTDDVILRGELKKLLVDSYEDVIEVTESGADGRRINRELLKQYIHANTQYCYVCGPDKFTEVMVDYLVELGVLKSQIVLEQ